MRIFPPTVTLFPGDRHLFTVTAEAPPPLWKDIANGPVTSFFYGVLDHDFSVRSQVEIISGNADDAFAEGALQLFGTGSVEFTITPNCLPASPSSFRNRWRLMFDGITPQVHQYTLFFFSTKIEIEYNFSLIATINHNVALGDRFRVDLSNGFRFHINDRFVHEKTTFASSIKPPATYHMLVNGIGGPPAAIIPAPRLEGAWTLRPVVEFLMPAHGSLSSAGPGLTTEYFNGTIPGRYTLVAKIPTGIEVWFEDVQPTGGVVTTGGGVWNIGTTTPVPFSGGFRLKSPLAVGEAFWAFNSATTTLQINKGDVISFWVFIDSVNPTQEIMLQLSTTADGPSAWPYRAYWGANLIAAGIDGTPSRRFIGPLPATNQWVRLEVPASLLDLEGRVLKGAAFSVFNGISSFDQLGKYPGQLQRVEAVITIPPLEILGALVRTFQPGQKVRIQTNYDVAQTPGIVTWSVVSGGGSFTAGEYTASSAPGTSVLRASSTGNQIADLTVNVPAVITPGFTFAAPLEQINFDTNIVSPTWTASAGVINSGTGEWIVPSNLGQTVKITATDGVFTATRDVLIIEKFPFSDFSLPVSWDRNLTALVSMSEDRTSRITREKAPPFDSYPVKLTSRTLAESNAVDAFFDAKGLGTPFILEDELRGIRKVGWFDSGIRHEARDECDIDLSFQFLETRI